MTLWLWVTTGFQYLLNKEKASIVILELKFSLFENWFCTKFLNKTESLQEFSGFDTL